MFLYAAAVQYNDPDPARWMLVYGVGAALSGVAAVRGPVSVWLAVGWSVACLVFAAIDAVTGVGQTDPMGGFPHWGPLRGEVTREVLGLLLMSGWTAVLAAWTHRRERRLEG